MSLRNPTANGKAQTDSSRLAGSGFIRAVKAHKNIGQVLLSYSDPCITYYSQCTSVFARNFNLYVPTWRCIFDCVINQDQEQAPKSMRISLYPNGLLGYLLMKVNLFGFRQGGSLIACVTNNLA